MWQRIALKHKQKSSQSGFITLEILVSIFIALAFVSVAMQTMVLAMMVKVQAQEKQRANQLIQEDMEDLQQQIASLTQADLTTFDLIDNPGDVCSPANNNEGYGQALWNAFRNKDKDAADITGTLPNPSYAETPSAQLIGSSGTQLGLGRTLVASTSPTTLRIRYQVQEWDGTNFSGDVIAERYVEVIPDVALECP